jgi:hypothetical protein
VEGYIDSGARYVGGGGALIEGQGGVGIAEQGDGEAANFQFVAEKAGES